jgi:primosomal protein N' (replication factor Y)
MEGASHLVEIAVSLPVPGTFTYRLPAGLADGVQTGARVVVPFGARKVAGYVLATDVPPPAPAGGDGAALLPDALRDVLDVLDEAPAFDAEMLQLFRWIARYYHAPLGEVIKTALPSALGVVSSRRVALTPLGRSAAEMPGADPLLRLLRESPQSDLSAPWLLKQTGLTMARLLRLERDGHVVLRREDPDTERGQRTERVAVHVLAPPLPPNAVRAREVLARVAQAGEIAVSQLREELGEVWTQLRGLEARGAIRIEERRVFRTPQGAFLDSGEAAAVDPPPLTPSQRKAVELIEPAIGARGPAGAGAYRGFLLHGVTSSGKTEVYLHLIRRCVDAGLSAIVLVPEIALTPQLLGRFRARFGDRVAVLHSALSDGERLDQWEQVRQGRLPIVVGARSAVFAPVRRLGLLVVDEEHEPSFKQEDQLRYQARDLALVRGNLAGAVVVLGSATPSLESIHNARRGKLTLVRLPERVHRRPLPEVTLVDLRQTATVDPDRTLSEPLLRALEETLAAGEQSLVFLNRRGYANFLLCRSCGFIHECPHCSISLTYHRERRRLVCHYCDLVKPLPERCPRCQGTLIQPMGVGTEKIESTLRLLLPRARIARMDRDTTRGAALPRLLRAVRQGDVDVLVGTQMVAKGHDFPNVTLVGALLADQGLKFPDFRAAERTFQLLTQVAGRAGRGERPGRVIVQTYDPGHHSLRHARNHDTNTFVDDELHLRRERGYPPFTHLALVRVTATSVEAARAEAERAARVLLAGERRRALGVLGPTPAPIERIKGQVRWHVLVRSPDRAALHAGLDALAAELDRSRGGSTSVVIDVDPVNLL